MQDDTSLVITCVPLSARSRAEICEHKGIGHPDSICDGVAEAVSRALSAAYLREYGQVQHHNVDKALLVGGRSAPRFGGGKIIVPPRLIVCGRATPLCEAEMAEFVQLAAREYLAATLRCAPDLFSIESAVHNGSPNLQRIFSGGPNMRVANDTSFGTGYAPLSRLEESVLRLSEILKSRDFRSAFPAAGDDYKIMAARVDESVNFTIALAFIDREVESAARYFEIKTAVAGYLLKELSIDCDIRINTLDAIDSVDETGIYLTVTGLSAEHGDDGQVGRGNRVNGLITPGRPMSLEAAAGKNPVSHVGKIYNVLATEMAQAISTEVDGVAGASVQLLSAIGKPVAEPQLIAIEVVAANQINARTTERIAEVARACLNRIGQTSERLIRGETPVF